MPVHSIPGWQPPTEVPRFFSPVASESADLGLSIAPLPGGRAIVLWPLGNKVRFAVLGSYPEVLQNGVIEAGDIQTALTVGIDVKGACVFEHGGQVYFTVLCSETSSTLLATKVYRADDPSNPTTWSLHGTIHPGSTLVGDFFGVEVAGLPYVLPSGRWVYEGTLSYQSFFGGTDFAGRDTGFWTSDNGGVTWTLRHTYTRGGPAHAADWASTSLALNPADGRLVGAVLYGLGTPDGVYTYSSSDSGITWGEAPYSGDDGNWVVFLDNAETIFALDAHVSNGPLYRLVGSTWVATGGATWSPGLMGVGLNDYTVRGRRIHVLAIDAFVFWCFGKWIAGAGRGWQMGSVAL